MTPLPLHRLHAYLWSSITEIAGYLYYRTLIYHLPRYLPLTHRQVIAQNPEIQVGPAKVSQTGHLPHQGTGPDIIFTATEGDSSICSNSYAQADRPALSLELVVTKRTYLVCL